MIKSIASINCDELLDSLNELNHGIIWTDYGKKKQAGLQHKLGEDPWTDAVGRSKGQELSYDQFNNYFANSVFETVIKTYNLKRTRLMWIDAYTCYSMHKDETPRIHIPLITNPQCFFVFRSGIIQHLPVGKVYWVDTRQKHTFINCSEFSRLHLVGVVES